MLAWGNGEVNRNYRRIGRGPPFTPSIKPRRRTRRSACTSALQRPYPYGSRGAVSPGTRGSGKGGATKRCSLFSSRSHELPSSLEEEFLWDSLTPARSRRASGSFGSKGSLKTTVGFPKGGQSELLPTGQRGFRPRTPRRVLRCGLARRGRGRAGRRLLPW